MELLAPAGSPAALDAALNAGADAVYLGLGAHNARMSAENFTWDTIDGALEDCHARGVRVYVTMNTLLMQGELPSALRDCERLALLGADALILQDLGLLRAVQEAQLPIALHASTQMTLHNPQGAAWAKSQGFARAVLARELSMGNIIFN